MRTNKKISLVCLVVLFLLSTGCKKDNNDTPSPTNNLIGTWEKVLTNLQDGDWMYTNETHTLTIAEKTINYDFTYDSYQISNPSNTRNGSYVIKGNYSLITTGLINFECTYCESDGEVNYNAIGKKSIGYYCLYPDYIEWATDFCSVSKRISGSSNSVKNSSFYNCNNNNNNYSHSKREFTETEIKYYNVQNNSSAIPTEWGSPSHSMTIEIHDNYYIYTDPGENWTQQYKIFENKLYELDDVISLKKKQ